MKRTAVKQNNEARRSIQSRLWPLCRCKWRRYPNWPRSDFIPAHTRELPTTSLTAYALPTRWLSGSANRKQYTIKPVCYSQWIILWVMPKLTSKWYILQPKTLFPLMLALNLHLSVQSSIGGTFAQKILFLEASYRLSTLAFEKYWP